MIYPEPENSFEIAFSQITNIIKSNNMSDCSKNQEYHIANPQSATTNQERNIRLVLPEGKTLEITKKNEKGSHQRECTIDIEDKAQGFFIGANTESIYLKVIDPIEAENIGPIYSMAVSHEPLFDIQISESTTNFIGTVDIRIGRAKLEFDGSSKFNIRYESETDRVYLEMHKHLDVL